MPPQHSAKPARRFTREGEEREPGPSEPERRRRGPNKGGKVYHTYSGLFTGALLFDGTMRDTAEDAGNPAEDLGPIQGRTIPCLFLSPWDQESAQRDNLIMCSCAQLRPAR